MGKRDNISGITATIKWTSLIVGIPALFFMLANGMFIEIVACVLFGFFVRALFSRRTTLTDYVSLLWWNQDDK